MANVPSSDSFSEAERLRGKHLKHNLFSYHWLYTIYVLKSFQFSNYIQRINTRTCTRNYYFAEEELARELEHSDSNEDDSQEISLEIEEKLLKDEPECKFISYLLCLTDRDIDSQLLSLTLISCE